MLLIIQLNKIGMYSVTHLSLLAIHLNKVWSRVKLYWYFNYFLCFYLAFFVPVVFYLINVFIYFEWWLWSQLVFVLVGFDSRSPGSKAVFYSWFIYLFLTQKIYENSIYCTTYTVYTVLIKYWNTCFTFYFLFSMLQLFNCNIIE